VLSIWFGPSPRPSPRRRGEGVYWLPLPVGGERVGVRGPRRRSVSVLRTSNLQQAARLLDARRGSAVLAGGDAGQRRELPRAVGAHRAGGPVEEVAAAIGAVVGDLERAQDQAGDGVARVADARHVAPGVGRVAGVDADRVAVDAAQRLVRLDLAGRPAGVAED